MEQISLRRVVPGNFTRRSHWAVDRGKNFGYALRQHDYIYARAVNNEEEIESLCEIGSDIGRSTAWFCEIPRDGRFQAALVCLLLLACMLACLLARACSQKGVGQIHETELFKLLLCACCCSLV